MPKRSARGWRGLLAAAIVAGFAMPGVASGATRVASTSGVDNVSCLAASPCLTVAKAISVAATGDIVQIGAGTFPVSSTIVVAAKTLTIEGAGPDRTILDGGSSTTFGNNGLLRFTGGNQTQTLRNFTIAHTGRSSASAQGYGIVFQPQGTPVPPPLNATITNVRYEGEKASESAFVSNNNPGNVLLDGVEATNVHGNAILLGRHIGPFTLRDSKISTSADSSAIVIFDYTWGGTNFTATGKHTYARNTIVGQTGLRVTAGFDYDTSLAVASYTGGVEVTDNTIRTGSSGAYAVAVQNVANSLAGVEGKILGISVTGNELDGAGAGSGVLVSGLEPSPTITGNDIRGFSQGVAALHRSVAYPHAPTSPNVNRNQIVDNGVASRIGLKLDAEVADAEAEDNWWGCNDGPPIGPAALSSDCDAIVAPQGTDVRATRWVQLGLTADPDDQLAANGTAAVTGSLAENNDGDRVSGVFDPSTRVAFTASGGTVADAAPEIGTDRRVGTMFTSTGPSGRLVSVGKDHENVSQSWRDIDVTAPRITITSPGDRSETNDDAVEIVYTVLDDADPEPACGPTAGSRISLDEGENTITVSCQDNAGNIGTATVRVTRVKDDVVVPTPTPTPEPTTEPQATPTPVSTPISERTTAPSPATTPNAERPSVPQAEATALPEPVPVGGQSEAPVDLPACAKDLYVSNVAVQGKKSRIRGRTRRKFAGLQIRIRYQPTGDRVIARRTITSTGQFLAIVRRPPNPPATADNARYQAQIGESRSKWIKLTRRLTSSDITYSGGKLQISGSVTKPLMPGAKIQVQRSDACGKLKTIGTVAVRSSGQFSGQVATPAKPKFPIAFIRLRLEVRGTTTGKPVNTFSIIQPVVIQR